MKLILQIALGVFLGTLVSQLVINSWHAHQEGVAKVAAARQRAEQEKVRVEQGEHIRALLLQSRQNNTLDARKPTASFVPDDVQAETLEEKQ
ncbi:MAG: hypothetical protein ACXWLH_06645 [Candidatus Saccharimonadales bacterium]